MKVGEVAERLEISISCVYQLLTAGKLRGTRHGLGRGTWRVTADALAEYLANAEQHGRRESPTPLPKGGSFKFLDAEKLRKAWEK